MPLGWCCWRWLAASNPGVSVRHMAAFLRCREVKFNGHFAIEVGNRSMIHGCLVAVALALRTAGGQGFCLDGVFDVRIIQLVSVIWNFTFHCTVSVYDLDLPGCCAGQVYKKVMAGERPRNLLRVKDSRFIVIHKSHTEGFQIFWNFESLWSTRKMGFNLRIESSGWTSSRHCHAVLANGGIPQLRDSVQPWLHERQRNAITKTVTSNLQSMFLLACNRLPRSLKIVPVQHSY